MGRFNLTSLALVTVLLLLQYALWLGDNNATDLWRLQQEVTAVITENTGLGERNAALAADVVSLKHNQEATEAIARQELGMIKPGESFVQIIER